MSSLHRFPFSAVFPAASARCTAMSDPSPRAAGVIGACLGVLLALAFAVAPAGAVVTKVGGIEVGLQPRSTSLFDGIGTHPETFANPGGGPVLPASKIYAIYWDPTDHYHGDWQRVIDEFLHRAGAESGTLDDVFAVDSQYTDAANQHALYKYTFMGVFTDTTPYPTLSNCTDPAPLQGHSLPADEPDAITCLTDTQLRAELETFISLHGLTKGMGTIYYLLTPPGVTVCLDGGGSTGHCSDYTGTPAEASYKNSFCSYHSDINPDASSVGDASTILYASIPWTAGGLGDGHLAAIDQTAGYRCQDGGFDPSSKPIEESEHPKQRNEKEQKEFEEKGPEEKAEQEVAEEREGPHQQEPNQVKCPSSDGTCDAGLPDLIINQIAEQQQDIVTDPLLNGWFDGVGNEATDECRNFFAPVLGGSAGETEGSEAGTLFNQAIDGGDYYLNDAFNLSALKLPYPGVPCLPGVTLEPRFTMPNPVNTGELVSFDGMESDITLVWAEHYVSGAPQPSYATYTWNFGDGTPTVSGAAPGGSPNSPGAAPCASPWESPCAGAVFHSYQYGGEYDVTLTVTDSGDNVEKFSETIKVNGPSRPSPETGGASETGGALGSGATSGGTSGGVGASATGATNSTGGSPTGVPGRPAVPGPVATQAVLSSSLSRALSKGLAVRYSVSQQATGHFEVLLAASIAHRLGLHGPLAGNLPQGMPAQVVIAKALLVTTKAGRNTLRIQFGKITAKRLRRLHKVSLLLRLNVRNAGGGTTTVLSKLTLH